MFFKFSMKMYKAWKLTHNHRQELLNTDITTTDYLLKFPCLNFENSYKLLKTDVAILHPDIPSFENKWSEEISNKIIFLAKKNRRDKSLKSILSKIEQYPEDKRALTIYMIPFLMTNIIRKRKSRENHPTSKAEVSNAFVTHVNTVNEAEIIERTRLEFLNSEKMSVQPKLYFLGSPITVAQLYIGSKKIVFSNPLEGFEATFYYIMGLNIKYPKMCEHIWLFFQQGVFEVFLDDDNKIPVVSAFISEVF